MDSLERARKYIESAGGAVSGDHGHSHTYALACNLLKKIGLTRDELAEALERWHNPQCDPPWTRKELGHKVDEAVKACSGLVGSEDQERRRIGRAGRPYILHSDDGASGEDPAIPATGIKFVWTGNLKQPMPEPMEDAARQLIRAAFRENEGVRIVHAHFNESGKEVPSAGLSLNREAWLTRLDATGGHVNDGKGFFGSEGNPGVYVSINPIEPGQTLDKHITAFRHALLEFDDLEREKQWEIFVESDLPITAVIDSGRRSLHAWVRVDAKDRAEYDQRVAAIYSYVSDYNPDPANKNPGRLSRLPGCIRLDTRQSLLALNIGAGTFAEWLAERAMDGVGQPLSLSKLLEFDSANDPNSVLGNRFLCRGGSLLLVAPSGVGKSTLATQMAFTWGLGQRLFGIRPKNKLKSLIIQAENDSGDIAEQAQGSLAGMNIDPSEHVDEVEDIRQNVVFVRDTIHTAEAFCSTVSRLVERHKPDLVFVDPLMSFLGGDVSSQEVCSRFFRNGLNPIAEATGIIFVIVHHTAKPPKEKAKSIEGWTPADYAYLGAGSHEITNWARAVIVLQQQQDDERRFVLSIVKRGRRAGATTLSGELTTSIPLAHSEHGLSWVQLASEPEQSEGANHSDGRHWFEKKWPGFMPQAVLSRLAQLDDLSQTAICDEFRSYARLFGKGPSGGGSSAQLVRDLLEIENQPGSGVKILEKYQANGKRGPQVRELYRVNLSPEFVKLRNDPNGFDEAPPIEGLKKEQ